MRRFLSAIFLICVHLFSSEVVNHVNVITGKLQLCFEDNQINGGIPLSVYRSYNSGHQTKASHAKWNFTEGWSFFSHAQLYLDDDFNSAHIIESNGGLISYMAEKSTKTIIYMKPDISNDRKSLAMNYRENPLNNRLEIHSKSGMAYLYLADGGVRIYKKSKKVKRGIGRLFKLYKGIGSEYLLSEETTSSGHKITFTYSEDGKKATVSNGFSSVTLQQKNDYPMFQIIASCCDGKKIHYSGKAMNKRCHLISMRKEGMAQTCFSYVEDEYSNKLWVENISISDQEVLNVTYVFPEVKNSRGLISRGQSVRFNDQTVYKVQSISKNGEKLCDFFYVNKVTTVRDCHGIDTKYHFSGGALEKIQYPDGSIEEFFWQDGNLIKKTYCDKEGTLLFSKTFAYDKFKNVICETITGDQSYSKWYTYNSAHLCIEEREESGLTFQYEYLKNTDLITCKRTLNVDSLLLEERTLYDENHLVKEKISSDGFLDTKTVYTTDPNTGLVTKIDNGQDTIFYEYNDARQLVKESTTNRETTTTYDGLGRILSKTHPLGGKEEYVYDEWGNPIQIKMIGSPKKTITYDKCHRPISCEVDGRVSYSKYDLKGNLIEEVDYKGASTKYVYDCFGRCIKKSLPLEIETLYEYDGFGNVVKETSPNGHITKTSYNIFHKPTYILFADGSEVFHRYSANGNLIETTLQDGSKITYAYDLLKRLISKKEEDLEEVYEYQGVLLKKVISSNGLITNYEHDSFGRKISEDVGGRKKEFFYDEMNLIYKTQQEDVTTIELHDIEVRVITTHTNDKGIIHYKYNNEGKKSKSTKITSCGKAEDRFAYDFEGRLISHIDPLDQKTLFLYEDYTRTEVDPLGHQTVEYFDPLSRVIETQKLDESGNLLFSETFSYDKEGNLARRFTNEHNIDVTYRYDCMNRLIEEVESGKKTTYYKYDCKGRLVQKTLPNGVEISTWYNGLDQITGVKSSDGTIHYEYIYDGRDLIEVIDHILNASLNRSYTIFGEVAEETNFLGFKTFWNYDRLGRVKQMILPDNSLIEYEYDESYMTSVSYYSSDRSTQFSHSYTEFDPNGHVETEQLPFHLGAVKSCRDILERPYKMSSPFHHIELTFGPTSLVTNKIDSLTGDRDYLYDPLDQLIKEGEKSYSFDSLGNPTDCKINDLNQIVSSVNEDFNYDANGNLTQRNETSYTFDAFGRLKTIVTPEKTVCYTYDPFSRIFSKQTNDEELIFLYDNDFEIGRMDSAGKIFELKVLGLGVKADAGASVALYLQGKWYVPLHDVQGNIIALVDERGVLQEKYPCNAFGEEESGTFINPWRFASKRMDEGLLIFRYRFYDPALKRWITPDPLGFVDGRNLYRYVLNSPLNRLDQFGLEVEWIFSTSYQGMRYNQFNSDNICFNFHSNFPTNISGYNAPVVFAGPATFSGINVDMMLICSRPNYIQLTANEIENREFNLFPKLSSIMSARDDQIGLLIYMNGINTTKEQFYSTMRSLAGIAPQGFPILGIYNPTKGVLSDARRVFNERNDCKTSNVSTFTTIFTELLDFIEKENIGSKGMLMPYSGSGATFCSTYNNMSPEDQGRMRKHFILKTVASAKPMSKDFGPETDNVYSKGDYTTGWFSNETNGNAVRMIDVKIRKNELYYIFKEHAILGPTYLNDIKEMFDDLHDKGRLHVGENR